MNIVRYVYGIYQTLGKADETPPTTDTAQSGLNGRLQRISQRLTTLLTAIDSITTLQTTSVSHLADIKSGVSGGAITNNTVITAKTAAENSADVALTSPFYAVTAIGLAGAETVTVQIKDLATGAYSTYVTLTAIAPVATLAHLPVTVRLSKSTTAASVGVVLSRH